MQHARPAAPARWERVTIRVLDTSLSSLVLALAAPALLALELLARRARTLCRVPVGDAWMFVRVGGGRIPSWLAALPLWWAVLRGRWSVIGGGAWRDGQPVDPPLRPGLISLGELRALNGLDRQGRRSLDAELARGWGLRAYLALLLRAWPHLLWGGGGGPRAARVDVHGISLQNTSLQQVLRTIASSARARARWWACFVNADCVNLARRDPAYRACLRRCDVVLPDGIGVRLAARLRGQVMGENLVGTDLLPELCALSARTGLRLYFLGAAPGVAAEAAQRLRGRYPGVQVVGSHHGYFQAHDAHERQVLEGIRSARPDVLLVGLGAPRQERWIERCLPALDVPVLLGVGGLFDYYAGRVPRSPLWLRELGLEWAFRLWQEPRRLWRRYVLGNPSFLAATACDLLARPDLARSAR